MGLKDIGHTLPPGFRFYPSDEELVCHYLYKKIANEQAVRGTLMDIDLHTCEPWQLPDVTKLNSSEWYFFSFRERKYSTGYRTNRATALGYWKATGKDRAVLSPSSRAVVGMRKTLVFYKNRAPNGIKTGWIMHEFRLENPQVPPKEDWVLCRVFHKSTGDNHNIKNLNPHNLYNHFTIPNLPLTREQYVLPSNFPNTSLSHRQSHNQEYYMGLNHNPNRLGLNPNPNPLGLNPDTDPLGLSSLEHPSTPSDLDYAKLLIDQTKCEDDYGFLFDMNFDSSNNGVLTNPDMI